MARKTRRCASCARQCGGSCPRPATLVADAAGELFAATAVGPAVPAHRTVRTRRQHLPFPLLERHDLTVGSAAYVVTAAEVASRRTAHVVTRVRPDALALSGADADRAAS